MDSNHRPDGSASRKRRRLPPPLEPPAALVRLLQDDAEVRQYFTALQSHLDADLRTWKDRAVSLKRENERLKSTASAVRQEDRTVPAKSWKQRRKESQPTKSDRKRKSNGGTSTQPVSKENPIIFEDSSHSSSANDEEEADQKRKSNPTEGDVAASVPLEVGVPIEDSMFDEMDSDDDEEEEEEEVRKRPALPLAKRTDVSATDELRTIPPSGTSDIGPFLHEAYDIFQRLGIALVTDRSTGASSTRPKDSINAMEAGSTTIAPSKNLKAIRTEQVMTDILRKIATNQLMIASSLNPDATFDRDDIATPSDYFAQWTDSTRLVGDHPLLEGKRLLIRALVLMDTFCSPSIPQKEWDQFFDYSPTTEVAKELLECMKIGLRSRKLLVDHLILFLNNSISERWLSEDRTQRLLNARVHFEEKDDDETEAEVTDVVGVKRSLFCGNLIERSTLCQLASFLLLLRNDVPLAVRNILQYMAAAMPFANTEEVPKLPPLLSLVALESLLLLSDTTLRQLLPVEIVGITKTEKGSTWFHCQILKLYPQEEERDRLYGSLALVVHFSAAIWEKRVASTRDTIHDVAHIELLSYKRLVSMENEWLKRYDFSTMNDGKFDFFELYTKEGRILIGSLFEDDRWKDCPSADGLISDQELRCLPLELSLLLDSENVAPLNEVVATVLGSEDLASFSEGQVSRFYDFLVVVAKVVRQSAIRRCHSSLCRNLGSVTNLLMKIGDCSEMWQRILRLSTSFGTATQLQLFIAALNCFGILADGSSVLSVMHVLLKDLGDSSSNHVAWRDVPDPLLKSVVDQIQQLSVYPVVRVINLERRKDRMQSFLQLAARERILTLKAVVDFTVEKPEADGFEFGRPAIDGSGRLVEATDRLLQYAGSLDELNNLVKPHWRPNDLKPFDVDAPSSESLVRISPSEKACALSHISSWKGVLRSLRLLSSRTYDSAFLRSPSHTLRLFKISGFARGISLLPQNRRMQPSPVCVILEDDAVLVERFRERLDALLQELPRDFHFCSLGYGRPKSAPIVPFSEHIGVPSMLWYLTGYCLSEVGAQYLLDAIPVVGPVDSWIGLKMTNNWDNIYGTKLGVGSHGKPKTSDFPSRDDLSRILQFHAYCAIQPLCSQKVRLSATAATGGAVVAPTRNGRHWRQRDTDIEYSGGDVSKLTEDDDCPKTRHFYYTQS